MKKIKQDGLELAFRTNAARNVTIIRRSDKEWYFTFEADDPLTQSVETYALLTKRGEQRIWADPRNLFAFLLEHFNVHTGRFNLIEEEPNAIQNRTDESPG